MDPSESPKEPACEPREKPPPGGLAALGRALALVLGSALVWAAALWSVRTWMPPAPLSFFLPIAAVGIPAFFAAAVGYRWRLPVPVVWSTLGYCLGSAIATAVSQVQFLAEQSIPASPAPLAATVALHTATATVMVPAFPAGWAYLWGNLLWVAVAVFSGIYGIETYRGRGPLAK